MNVSIGVRSSIIMHALFVLCCFFYVSQDKQVAVTERVIAIDLVNIKTAATTNLKNVPINVKKKSLKPDSKEGAVMSSELSGKKTQKSVVKSNLSKEVETVKNLPEKGALDEINVRQNDDESDKILESLEKKFAESVDHEGRDNTGPESHVMTDKPYDRTQPLTISESDSIKAQVERKFFNPVILDFKPGELIIRIKLYMKQNGEIEEVAVFKSRLRSDEHSDAVIALRDSLIRAAHMASPLQGLNKARYEGVDGWKEIEVVFDAYHLMHMG